MVHVMHCEGRGWQFEANDEFHMELWGNHAIIRPVGELYVKFSDGDEYCWSTVRAPLTLAVKGSMSCPYRRQSDKSQVFLAASACCTLCPQPDHLTLYHASIMREHPRRILDVLYLIKR